MDDFRPVDVLANRALRMVASGQGRAGRSPAARHHTTNVAALQEAALNGDRQTCLDVVHRLIQHGVSRETVADVYIPTIARQMGDAWCLDDMSFAEVTIGVARLQSLLRDLGPEWRADSRTDPEEGAALVVVALDEYHTLGAMVLAGRLRRAGLSVRLQMGLTADDLRREMDVPRYDAVLISASRGESLETLRLLVKAVKTSPAAATPVIIGGSVLESEQDILALTGADLVTSDPIEAMEHCGLKTDTRPDVPRAPGT